MMNHMLKAPKDPVSDDRTLPKSPGGRLAYYCAALLLAGGGAWLVLMVLGNGGYDPFSTQRVPFPPEEQIYQAFTPSVSYWAEEILAWSNDWGLDPLLVATVMQIESCGNPSAKSPAGAQGLFQVMPYHFSPGENAFDPETNARRGLAYLSQAQSLSGGDITQTLAGYNGGHGQITREASLWPEETQRYTNWGEAIFAEASANAQPPRALSTWLEAGGWFLCQQAEQALGLQ